MKATDEHFEKIAAKLSPMYMQLHYEHPGPDGILHPLLTKPGRHEVWLKYDGYEDFTQTNRIEMTYTGETARMVKFYTWWTAPIGGALVTMGELSWRTVAQYDVWRLEPQRVEIKPKESSELHWRDAVPVAFAGFWLGLLVARLLGWFF